VTVGAFLGDGRRLAESLMLDTCTIRRPGHADTTDDLTGQITRTATTVYSGKCKVQQSTRGMGHRHDVGEEPVLLLRLELHLPVVGSEGLAEGDQVTITTAVHDTDLAGRVFVVHDLEHKSFATARRLMVTEVT
jgi:hypothetical protein